MATHQVIVKTSGGQSGGTLIPPSLTVDANDQIIFTSQHQPKSPPVQIGIKFSSENICSTANPPKILTHLLLQGNTSQTVQVCPKLKSNKVTYKIAGLEELDPEGDID